MAQTIRIEVTVDDKGVVTGIKNIEGGIEKVGARGGKVFGSLTQQQRQARDAAQLLSQTLGVQVPSSLQKILSKLPGVSGALAATFRVAIVVAFAAAIVKLVNNFDEVKAAIRDAGFELSVFGERMRSLVGLGDEALLAGVDAIKQQQKLVPLIGQVEAAHRAAAVAGKEGSAAIIAGMEQQIIEINKVKQQALAAGLAGLTDQKKISELMVQADQMAADAILAVKRAANRQLGLEQRRQVDETRKMQDEVNKIGLHGAGLIVEAERAALEDIKILYARRLLAEEEFDKRKAAITQRSIEQFRQLQRTFSEEALQIINRSQESGLQGIALVDAQVGNEKAALRQHFIDLFGSLAEFDERRKQAARTLQAALTGIDQEGETKRKEIRQQVLEQTIQAEERAAIAALPPWVRANAGIVVDYNGRIREIKRQLGLGLINEGDAARQTAAVWLETNARIADEHRQMVDQMASELESIFDDIFSGNIAKRILSIVKRFFFQILSQWLLTLGGIRNAAAGGFQPGGGGLLGGILGSLFGLGAGGGGGLFGGGLGTVQPTPPTFGALPGGGGGFTSFGDFVIPGLTQKPLGAGQPSAGTGFGGAIPGLGGFQQQNPLLNLLFKGLPGGIAALGGLGLGLGISGISSGNIPLAAIGGGLSGFAIGSALFAAGPIGAVIGAVVGILGAIISRKRKSARAFKDAQKIWLEAKKQIEETKQAYMDHQLGFDDAMSTLDDIRSQTADALIQSTAFDRNSKWGKRYISQRLDPAVAEAKEAIQRIETERQARGATVFGGPQFHGGGYTGAGSGEFNARLLRGEFVVNPMATAQHRELLEAINHAPRYHSGGFIDRALPLIPSGPRGRTGQVPQLNIHIHAIDSADVRDWLRNRGGLRAISQETNRAMREGGRL